MNETISACKISLNRIHRRRTNSGACLINRILGMPLGNSVYLTYQVNQKHQSHQKQSFPSTEHALMLEY